jgi:hypothetical protein
MKENIMQNQITQSGPLLDVDGKLVQAGWSPQPLLDCNLEQVGFYGPILRPFQRLRLKRWDYYAVFFPGGFFSATIADLGYAGNIFVYLGDFEKKVLHEQGLVIPFSKGITLPRNSDQGQADFHGKGVELIFRSQPTRHELSVDWPSFHDRHGIQAEIHFNCPASLESMNIVIPMAKKRFYLNRKINCLPAEGWIRYGRKLTEFETGKAIGSLDWGRGAWPYQSFWNWASASGYLTDGSTFGINLGKGFGDLSAATENCLVLNGVVHKLDQVEFLYDPKDFMQAWHFSDNQGRLNLEFAPFLERVARTNLGLIFSEVHQLFGTYSGTACTDDGQVLPVQDLVGFAEEHHARW